MKCTIVRRKLIRDVLYRQVQIMKLSRIADQYNHQFFQTQLIQSSRSAAKLVPLVLGLVSPKTIVDVGCGIGCWAAQFLSHGMTVTGIDGDWVDRTMLQISETCFIPHDLNEKLQLEQVFDLAVCIEVAEHLPESRASGLVDDLVSLSPCVLFSAAVPGQGGTGHINEQPLSYWVTRFAERGYQPADCLRSLIWEDDSIDWWIRQNIVVFAKLGHPILLAGNGKALDLYHPSYVAASRDSAEELGVRICFKRLRRAVRRAVQVRLQTLVHAFFSRS
jgi:SAM-dependent methyltransferase